MSSRVAARTLLALALVPASAASAASADPGPALSVDVSAGRHAISPNIYGWNFAPADIAAAIDLPVDRRGGNSADTLNWQTGVENHSFDFFFENIPWCWTQDPCDQNQDPSQAYTKQIDMDRAVQAKTLIDLPMLGYVPKDNGANDFTQPLPCSFPKSAFATQNAFDPYQDAGDPNLCGDGHPPGDKESWVTNTPQLGNARAAGPAFQGQWIDDLKSRYGDAAHGGVAFYELGNEPALWSYTHHDWRPARLGATELRDKMLALAEVVKSKDPTAQVIGPAEWGWPNYFCSDADGGCGPDGPGNVASDWRDVQGGKGILEWILSEFKAYADANGGKRLLDYLDVHYYRQDNGSSGLAATRSLWDPTYTDPSWINDTVRLIPRMKQWVADNYPGTKIALSEYDVASDTASAAQNNLIQADTLGIFAREGMDLATLWPEVSNDQYVDAFKLFRNYDGAKSKFGDTYVSSQSGDQSKLAVYGAQRSGDGALTLVVINKSPADLTSTVALSNFAAGTSAQVWRYKTAGNGIQRATDQAVTASGFTATFPNRSMTMVVVPAATTPGGGTTPPAGGGPGSNPPPSGGGTTSATRCVVPRLKGLTLKKARAKLRKARCSLGKVTKKKSKVRKGRVIAQKPRAQTKLKTGARVSVVLSRGP